MRIVLLIVLLLAIGCNVPAAEEVPIVNETETIAVNTSPSGTQVALSPTAPIDIPMPTATSLADTLPVIQAAPEIANEIWLNSDPIKLSDLRGKVVLVEFWTFG